MPWETVSVMDAKRGVVELYLSGAMTMAEACEAKGVSRKTGYKWLARWNEQGREGLEELTRAPKTSPQAWPEETRDALLELKRKRPTWGPKKLVASLSREGLAMPAASTAGTWLREEGLTKKRRRPTVRAKPTSLTVATRPNEVWCYDFKGQVRLGNGQLCYPLTVTDDYSRMLLGCFALDSTSIAATQPCVESLFREHGLPEVLHSDNGTPFASTGLSGLTTMSVAWLKQGIRLERSRPATPTDNARHERMHRTLKAEAMRPPSQTMSAQQLVFDAWRFDFNTQRPHEALGMSVPISLYQASGRGFLEGEIRANYPGHFDVRHVGNRGQVKMLGHSIYLSEALIGQHVGLIEVDDGLWQVHFLSQPLCALDIRGPRPKLIGHSP